MSARILVYGTLKRGQPNHYLLTEAPGSCTYLGKGVTVDRWPLVVAGPYNIPCLLDVKGTGKHVCGEVYLVDEPRLETCDRLEHHPYFYTRVPVQMQLTTDADDAALSPRPPPEMIQVYMIQRPVPALLDLPMLENYDPLSISDIPKQLLPLEREANLEIWNEFIGQIKQID